MRLKGIVKEGQTRGPLQIFHHPQSGCRSSESETKGKNRTKKKRMLIPSSKANDKVPRLKFCFALKCRRVKKKEKKRIEGGEMKKALSHRADLKKIRSHAAWLRHLLDSHVVFLFGSVLSVFSGVFFSAMPHLDRDKGISIMPPGSLFLPVTLLIFCPSSFVSSWFAM